MSDLQDFVAEADKRSNFVKFNEDEPTVLRYIDAELIDDQFTPGQKTMQYTVEMDGTSKTFKSKSASLARQMSKIEPGTEVEVTKEGQGFKTKWYVKQLKASKAS